LADELLCRHQAGSRSKNTLLFSGGTGTPIQRAKPKFRTAREIEDDMEGLEVPNVLKSLVDAGHSELAG
jgi:hypothetical protein